MTKEFKYEEVPIENLRWRCDPDTLGFDNTDEVPCCEEIIGQERALKAIKLGLEVKSPGYNIFVSGLTGTGKTTTIKQLLEQINMTTEKVPDDICYVNNFKNTDMPQVVFLPAGKGRTFRKDMDRLIEYLKRKIPLIFESEDYKNRSKEIVEDFRNRSKELVKTFEQKVKAENFALVQIQMGPVSQPEIVPLIEGEPMPMEKLEELVTQKRFSAEKLDELKDRYTSLSLEMGDVLKEGRNLEKEMQKRLGKLEREFGSPVVRGQISDLKDKYKNDKISKYLDETQNDILQELEKFKTEETNQVHTIPGMPAAMHPDFAEYEVNVIVDNSETKGVPIIIETTPSYKNLFGTIEKNLDRAGVWKTDFTKIRAGSILRANGGYLVLNLIDAVVEPGVWTALKRTLKNRKVNIQGFDPLYMFTSSALKPEEIDIDVKVAVIGDARSYHILYNLDEDFRKIFKVKADFDTLMTNDKENILKYANFIRKVCDSEKLKPFDKTGVAAVVEYGVEIAGRQNKLSTRFSDIADIVREANYWASGEKSKYVTENHVDKAIEEKIYRVKLMEEKIQEMIDDETIMIDTDGEKVGQMNGLSVYNLGDYSFGKPSRITAEIAMGRAGIINIEREADMSGPTHNKGVLIIGGFFRGKYAHDKPLTMSASLAFEQSYSGVDGDSASSTEIYALMSSLSELPLRQDIAVTGSVNQKGEIQPIGGVNQKIEGFYDVCTAKGLSGKQGVMIPHQNIKDLMLRKDVIESVKKGKFHIYPVATIDQGIELLTGVRAGQKQEDGTYPEKTVNFFVNKRLAELADGMKDYFSGSNGAS